MSSSSSDVEMDAGPHINDLAYDPDQDPEEKRDVRKKYRAIQKTTDGTSANTFNNTILKPCDIVP